MAVCHFRNKAKFPFGGLLQALMLIPVCVWAQNPDAPTKTTPASIAPDPPVASKPNETPLPGTAASPLDKRIFGVLPNYRTANPSAVYHPITARYKLKIALKDSFDYPLFMVATVYAGLYQLEDSHPQFGQVAQGYFKRLGTNYCDQINGNMLTEGIMPILFREDPRYFRLAEGTKTHRTLYALTRIFVTKTDKGHNSVNFAELVGNGIASGVGLSYYEDSRNVPDYLQNWGTQLGTDAVSQVLKEFWPDVKHWWKRRHSTP